MLEFLSRLNWPLFRPAAALKPETRHRWLGRKKSARELIGKFALWVVFLYKLLESHKVFLM
jgi:hypothetical protein